MFLSNNSDGWVVGSSSRVEDWALLSPLFFLRESYTFHKVAKFRHILPSVQLMVFLVSEQYRCGTFLQIGVMYRVPRTGFQLMMFILFHNVGEWQFCQLSCFFAISVSVSMWHTEQSRSFFDNRLISVSYLSNYEENASWLSTYNKPHFRSSVFYKGPILAITDQNMQITCPSSIFSINIYKKATKECYSSYCPADLTTTGRIFSFLV